MYQLQCTAKCEDLQYICTLDFKTHFKLVVFLDQNGQGDVMWNVPQTWNTIVSSILAWTVLPVILKRGEQYRQTRHWTIEVAEFEQLTDVKILNYYTNIIINFNINLDLGFFLIRDKKSWVSLIHDWISWSKSMLKTQLQIRTLKAHLECQQPLALALALESVHGWVGNRTLRGKM